MTKQIQLSDVLNFSDPGEYKVHLANWNEGAGEHPLVVFLRDKEKWKGWHTWGSTKNDWNRKYIFSLIQIYYEKDVWLFGGIFEVISTNYSEEEECYRYNIELTNKHEAMIGRLKIYFERGGRTKHRKMEETLEKLFLHEILPSEHGEGEAFCGYGNIKHSFQKLEQIFRISKPDWKHSLENIEGVYMIMDMSNGKKYIGSAYGESGIWSRWSCYLDTGHGHHSDELTKIISKEGKGYARENFIFSLLEWRSKGTYNEETIINRESYWKEILLSRHGDFGYNSN